MLEKLAVQDAAPRPGIPLWEKIVLSVWALIPLLSVNQYILQNNGAFNVLLAIPVVFVIYFARAKCPGLSFRAAAGSFIFAFVLVAGESVYRANDIRLLYADAGTVTRNILVFISYYILFYFTIKLVLYYLGKWQIKIPAVNEWRLFGRSRSAILAAWGFIFAAWVPCYLAYFPGSFAYDIVPQTFQVLGLHQFNRLQTAAHTFFTKLTFELGLATGGGPNAGLIVYSVTQMLILSLVFALTIRYMAKINMHYGFRLAALAYFAFNPMNALFSFTPTRDVLFTALFILVILMLADAVKDSAAFFRSIPRQLALCLALIACCLFRNNAVYAFVLFFIFFVIIYRKYHRNIIVIFAVFMAGYTLINGPLYTALGVGRGNFREALSVPMQQIANSVVKHDLQITLYELDIIDELMNYDAAKVYFNPRLADPVKNFFNIKVFEANPQKYIKIWAALGKKYPVEYVNAALSLNIGSWYPLSEYTDKYSKRIYIETFINDIKEFKITRESVFPGLLEKYEEFASGEMMRDIPIVSLLFSISFPIWFLLGCVWILFAKGRRKHIVLLLPALFIWLTFLVGPVSNLRYMYFIIALYPFYAALVLQPDSSSV